MPKKSTLYKLLGGLRTLKGGVQLALAGGSTRFITWPALAALTGGTDVFGVNGTRFTASVYIPHNVIVTGIGFLVGSIGGTDKAIVELHDADGTLLGNSAVAGVTVGTAATMQDLPLTTPIEVVGPGWYFLSVTFNGATAKLRALAAATAMASTALTKSAAGTFGTVGALTVPTTFTADVGPIAYTY